MKKQIVRSKRLEARGLIMVLITSCFLLLTSNVQAQFNFISTSTDTISANDSTYVVDSKGYKLAALILPATVTATAFTILTSATNVDSMFKVVNYEGTDLTITASDGEQCGVAPNKVNQLLRYIKFRGDVKEAAKRTIYTVFTNF